MEIPGLSESLLEERAERSSIERGKEYFAEGAVKALKRRSDTEVEAFVMGTDVAPYRVELRHDERGITSAECTCPYVTGSWCRHIVATLLAVMEREGALRRPIAEVLDDFGRDELIRLIERLIAKHPEAASIVESFHRQKESR